MVELCAAATAEPCSVESTISGETAKSDAELQIQPTVAVAFDLVDFAAREHGAALFLDRQVETLELRWHP